MKPSFRDLIMCSNYLLEPNFLNLFRFVIRTFITVSILFDYSRNFMIFMFQLFFTLVTHTILIILKHLNHFNHINYSNYSTYPNFPAVYVLVYTLSPLPLFTVSYLNSHPVSASECVSLRRCSSTPFLSTQ
jgi:hypothetical protein